MIEEENCQCRDIGELQACTLDCECQYHAVEDGYVMACDECGSPGLVESDGWVGVLDDNGGCMVYCCGCAWKNGLEKIDPLEEEKR